MRTSGRDRRLRGFVAVLTCVAITSAARANLMATNAAGVRAGITGIVTTPANDINVQFSVRDPTGTNVTTLAIQRSPNLTNWTDYSTLTVTGNYPVTGIGSAQISDFAPSLPQFYRMRLINF